MIAALLASQISKKRRMLKRTNNSNRDNKSNAGEKRKNVRKLTDHNAKETQIDKVALLKRYMSLMKISMLSFILSTTIHIGLVTGYYYVYLWLNPDDPGKKKFYSETTVQKGVNIGGRIIGGGGIQTNHHKSYLMHLVREHYQGLSKLFLIQFSAIYLLILSFFKFFPEREKLKHDTQKAFNWNNEKDESTQLEKSNEEKPKKYTKKRVIINKSKIVKTDSNDEYEDLIETTDEDFEEQEDDNNLLIESNESKKDI